MGIAGKVMGPLKALPLLRTSNCRRAARCADSDTSACGWPPGGWRPRRRRDPGNASDGHNGPIKIERFTRSDAPMGEPLLPRRSDLVSQHRRRLAEAQTDLKPREGGAPVQAERHRRADEAPEQCHRPGPAARASQAGRSRQPSIWAEQEPALGRDLDAWPGGHQGPRSRAGTLASSVAIGAGRRVGAIGTWRTVSPPASERCAR